MCVCVWVGGWDGEHIQVITLSLKESKVPLHEVGDCEGAGNAPWIRVCLTGDCR